MTPLVAVTGPAKRFKPAWWATRFNLALSGVDSLYLTAASPTTERPVQGVIIGGGDDIEPIHYGAQGDAGSVYDPERDAFEMAVIRHCLNRRVPLLGICRGAQLINVVLGGSLFSDIRPLRKRTPNYNSVLPVKWVSLDPHKDLSFFMQKTVVKVNSLHSQAVDRLGEGLECVARDRDGFVQAIEHAEGFVLGVQWHPEYLPYQPAQRRLFDAFTNAVREAAEIHLCDDYA